VAFLVEIRFLEGISSLSRENFSFETPKTDKTAKKRQKVEFWTRNPKNWQKRPKKGQKRPKFAICCTASDQAPIKQVRFETCDQKIHLLRGPQGKISGKQLFLAVLDRFDPFWPFLAQNSCFWTLFGHFWGHADCLSVSQILGIPLASSDLHSVLDFLSLVSRVLASKMQHFLHLKNSFGHRNKTRLGAFTTAARY
jgi:hypothetical protein